MSTYESKLAEWFKQVEKQEQELKARKQPGASPEAREPEQVVEQARAVSTAEAEAPEAAQSQPVAAAQANEVIADARLLEPVLQDGLGRSAEREEVEAVEREEAGAVFEEEEDEPQVEDFFSFLGRPEEPAVHLEEMRERRRTHFAEQPAEPAPAFMQEAVASEPAAPVQEPTAQGLAAPVQEPPVEEPPAQQVRAEPEMAALAEVKAEPEPPARPAVEIPREQTTLDLAAEGTGEPIPVSELLASQSQPQPDIEAAAVQQKAQVPPAPVPEPPVVSAPVAAAETLQESWDRMPHHLQTLFAFGGEEVAQNSYKTFKETRGQLIQRLLDPIISLEEAARLLNVCPTTVRRYTNRGVLRHIRTAGNQRRFRLSDVLSFMESSVRSGTREG